VEHILGLLSGELVVVKKFVNYGSHSSKSLKFLNDFMSCRNVVSWKSHPLIERRSERIRP
jgi:hypothetical protein